MSKVLTFSTKFPTYHPKAGQPTFFVKKIWESLIICEEISLSKCCELLCEVDFADIPDKDLDDVFNGSKSIYDAIKRIEN